MLIKIVNKARANNRWRSSANYLSREIDNAIKLDLYHIINVGNKKYKAYTHRFN